MPISKSRKRYHGIADSEERAIRLFHLFQDDFPGISFEHRICLPGECGVGVCYPTKTIIDNRGKLRLDENDGTPVPDAQYPNALLKDGTRSLEADLPVAAGKKIDGVDISEIVDNIINEPHDKQRTTQETSYTELTYWRFRKSQHKTVYLQYRAYDDGVNGTPGVKITIQDAYTEVIYENTGISGVEGTYEGELNISTLVDGWCTITLEAKARTGMVGAADIYINNFTITVRRT